MMLKAIRQSVGRWMTRQVEHPQAIDVIDLGWTDDEPTQRLSRTDQVFDHERVTCPYMPVERAVLETDGWKLDDECKSGADPGRI